MNCNAKISLLKNTVNLLKYLETTALLYVLQDTSQFWCSNEPTHVQIRITDTYTSVEHSVKQS